jgi:hypothetical protein
VPCEGHIVFNRELDDGAIGIVPVLNARHYGAALRWEEGTGG